MVDRKTSKRNKENRPTEIINSALKLFEKKGFEETSFSDIAKDCDIARSTIYLYFSDKNDLIEKAIIAKVRENRDSFLEGKISKNIVRNDDTIAGYLAGAFLASGSINSPKSSNYHLEISLDSENYAKWMIHLFKRYKNIDIVPKIAPRRNKYILYFKKSDRIAEFLALVGAINSCMDFENIRVDRDFMNSANRLSNFDTANMKKSFETANRQKEEIKFIDSKLGIDNITNKKMRILCSLRLENETASMKELAELLSLEINEPVSKSNINHLFRAIHELYLRLSNEN